MNSNNSMLRKNHPRRNSLRCRQASFSHWLLTSSNNLLNKNTIQSCARWRSKIEESVSRLRSNGNSAASTDSRKRRNEGAHPTRVGPEMTNLMKDHRIGAPNHQKALQSLKNQRKERKRQVRRKFKLRWSRLSSIRRRKKKAKWSFDS